MYHRHLYNYEHRINENIYYLERVQQADFANPLYAIVPIENKVQWERYRNLFNMHISLLLVEQYLQLSSRYTKYTAYFFNYPWKDENIGYLTTANELLEVAQYYWKEAQEFSTAAWRQHTVKRAGKSYWENQNYRIENNMLDYDTIIARHRRRIVDNIAIFEGMDRNTY